MADNKNKKNVKNINKKDDHKIISLHDVLPDSLVVVPTLQKPVFPGMIVPVVFSEGKYSRAILHVWQNVHSKDIGFILSKDGDDNEPEKEQLYQVGVSAKILKMVSTEDGSVQVLINSIKRFTVKRYVQEEPYLVAKVDYHEDNWDKSDVEIRAMATSIIGSLRDFLKLNPLFSEQVKLLLSEINSSDPGKLSDFASLLTSTEKDKLQDILETFDVKKRLNKVMLLLVQEKELLTVKEKINNQIENKVSKNQREFFLQEQLKAIKKELGMQKDPKTAELDKILKRAEKVKFSEEAKERFDEEMEKLKLIDTHSPEFAVTYNYLDWLVSLPWEKYTKDSYDIKKARKVLDRDHYGLDDVKKRIIEFISVNKLKGSIGGSILCFVGPPGVGKTSLGKAIAKTLNREFYRFSLGGMRDEAEIKGHRKTYIGAMPGKMIQALKRCKSANPIIMLDEIDKIGNSYHGDPASALLEVLDPEQNVEFLDHYCDVKFDLSKILFIVTANVTDTIPPALLDRMDVMHLSGYIIEEKIHIAQKHIIPRQIKEHGLKRSQVKFSISALRKVVTGYAREAGVRNMEREINNILRKCATQIVEKPSKKFSITPDDVRKFLGQEKFNDDPLISSQIPGVVMGLAWTAYGGSTLYIESIGMPSKSKGFKQTGQLGDVMVESSDIAYSYVTSVAHEKYNVEEDFFSKHFIHLHVPAGATPKDGPSAGVTMGISLLSLATGIPIKKHIAMTGELTLTGRVLPVGGIKEKIIAAKRAGVKLVVMPKENKKDFEEIPKNIRKGIKATFVEEFNEVPKIVLSRQPKK